MGFLFPEAQYSKPLTQHSKTVAEMATINTTRPAKGSRLGRLDPYENDGERDAAASA